MDFDKCREMMVQKQLLGRGIKNELVLGAMSRIHRHLFIKGESPSIAYGDFPVYIGHGQTISQPYMVALMTQKLQPFKEMKVLEIGTGSGYQTAILAETGKQVFTIERINDLSKRAEKVITKIGYENVTFHVGDGTLGLVSEAPFDRIIVTAAAPNLPSPLVEQLKPDGIMVIPVGDRFYQTLKIVRKENGNTTIIDDCGCVFVKLIGVHGWTV